MLPVARLMELLADLTDHRISEGTLFNVLETMNDRLDPFEQDLKTVLLGESVVHFDESGLRVGETNHWIHSASSQDATYDFVHRKRGTIAIAAAGILPTYTGIASHDGWSA